MVKYSLLFGAFLLLLVVAYTGYAFTSFQAQPFFSAPERDSPSNWIESDQIIVLSGGVTVDIKDAVLTSYANTNSMDPVLDESAHGIEIPPVEEKLRVGDIISYKSNEYDTIIVHRIIAIEQDELGTYYIVQGDNNFSQDAQKVRFSDIVGVVVGLIY